MDIKYYTDENDVSPLEKWLAKNRAAIPKVFTAVERLRSGNTSSVKWLSGRPGIGEYRINWGAGLRVYLMQDGDEIVILLCAGFKDRQNNDLDAAEKYRADYLRSKKHDRA